MALSTAFPPMSDTSSEHTCPCVQDSDGDDHELAAAADVIDPTPVDARFRPKRSILYEGFGVGSPVTWPAHPDSTRERSPLVASGDLEVLTAGKGVREKVRPRSPLLGEDGHSAPLGIGPLDISTDEEEEEEEAHPLQMKRVTFRRDRLVISDGEEEEVVTSGTARRNPSR